MKVRAGSAVCALMVGVPAIALGAGTDNRESYQDATKFVVAAQDADAPLSKDDLFGLTPQAEKPKLEQQPSSKELLFGVEPQEEKGAKPKPQTSLPWQGFLQTEFAYAYDNPAHWSKTMGRLEVGTHGQLGSGINWKASGRLDYNPVYDLTNYYNDAVRNDQLVGFQVRETYLDFSAAGLDWRVGRQQIVWGEMVGMFVADVVSALDVREFVLPDFQVMRIPQWAARAEYFKDDFHAEFVWIPFPSYNEIGKPFEAGRSGAGSDFYPYPVSPAGVPLVQSEERPDYTLNHTNIGFRLTQLTNGWDVSGFVYSSMDAQPTFYRDPINKQVFYPRHDRIWQAGGTLGKDLGFAVLKAEAVYTHGRSFNTLNLADEDGVVKQPTLDWAVGLDFNPTADTRLNAQVFQRVYFDHDPYNIFDRVESGASLLANYKFSPAWEAEALWVSSLNRSDWMLRPKVIWKFQPNWRLTSGVDVFHGPLFGLFGRFDQADRVYAEVRHDF
jgi:hypothetical protein